MNKNHIGSDPIVISPETKPYNLSLTNNSINLKQLSLACAHDKKQVVTKHCWSWMHGK